MTIEPDSLGPWLGLIGVVTGVSITTATNWLQNRRRDRAECEPTRTCAGCRLSREFVTTGWLDTRGEPHHRRASLVVLTDKGRQTYDEAGRLQAPWANRLSEDLAIKDIDTTRRVVAELRRRLELNGERAST